MKRSSVSLRNPSPEPTSSHRLTTGTFTIAFPDTDPENVTDELPFNITRAKLQLALEALPAIVPGDVVLTEVDPGELGPNQVAYDIEFTRELSSQDLPLLLIDDTLVVDGSVASADVQPGLDTGLNDVQVVTINATAGTYQLELYLPAVQKTLLTASLPYDADAEQVRRALETTPTSANRYANRSTHSRALSLNRLCLPNRGIRLNVHPVRTISGFLYSHLAMTALQLPSIWFVLSISTSLI